MARGDAKVTSRQFYPRKVAAEARPPANMSKVQPAIRRRYCVCGRVCGDLATTWNSSVDSSMKEPSNGVASADSNAVPPEKSVPMYTAYSSTSQPPAVATDSLTLLQLKVRALEKYKTNYELLCSQLAELNAQVGLQLQRHEVDVTTLQATIAALQTTNATLQHELLNKNEEVTKLKSTSEKDREYADGVHRQLTTVAELLKAAEKRLEDQENTSQNELKSYKATQDEYTKLQRENETLALEMKALKEQLVKQGDGEKLRKKYRGEIKTLRLESEELREELEQQRAAARQLKKQARHMRDERDALAKQLGHVKSDGTHLTEIIESQREEVRRQERKAHQWKRAHQESENRLNETLKSLEDTQFQLSTMQETLVEKNARIEELTLEMRELRQKLESRNGDTSASERQIEQLQSQLQSLQKAYDAQKKQVEVVVQQEELDAKEMQRKYRKELQHMKQLLSLNHQRTSESTQDMQVLKQELSSVQELLRRCHKQQRRVKVVVDESDDEVNWRMRHQRAEVEKAVLQSAIMEQVEKACAL